MRWLTDPFSPVFMQRALLELALLSAVAGALGAFVVLRRLAFSTHALGVGAFPGAVVAYGVGASAFAGGLVSSLLIAVGLASLGRRRDLDAPAATGPLLAALAVTAVATVDAVGSLLVSALFVVPAATARLVTRRLPALVAAAAGLALVESVVGLWLAYRLDAPPGATVAICSTVAFAIVFAGKEIVSPGRRRLLLVGGAAALVTLGAAGAATAAGSRTAAAPLPVVATTPLIVDWVRAVGGADVTVHGLIRPLVDPHEFEPGTGDAAAVAQAKLVVASGAGLDAWIEGLARGAGRGSRLIELAPLARLRHAALGSAGDELDPHYWLDPELATLAIGSLRDALATADPGHAAAYRRRTGAYLATLRALDRTLVAAFATVPAARRVLVTDHDAFGYLARRYGLRIVGAAIPSTSTAASANARDIARLIDTIRREHVPTLFSESSVDPKLIRQIAGESGARVESGLYGDTLGAAGSGADTYLGLLRLDGRLLVAGLTGQAAA